ncbi:MAG: tRNA (guanosine(46)-N7)-methyltransferase TrmB [Planctomycetota bacterium]|jgi:tRNA (guanine-N7-)-methyltransferase
MARILKDYPAVALKIEDLPGPVDFARVFGRAAPVHIEIGCGKGTFLLNEARARPQVNFLGIEWANRYYRFAVDRIGRWAVPNVRIIRTDAAVFLTDLVPGRSVDCFHIYFPDPWPKKRHHKRRLLTGANLERLLAALRTGGAIRVATDHAEYFEVITHLFQANAGRLQQTDFLPTAGAELGEWVGTNFERKYLKQNRPIRTIAMTKVQ